MTIEEVEPHEKHARKGLTPETIKLLKKNKGTAYKLRLSWDDHEYKLENARTLGNERETIFKTAKVTIPWFGGKLLLLPSGWYIRHTDGRLKKLRHDR